MTTKADLVKKLRATRKELKTIKNALEKAEEYNFKIYENCEKEIAEAHSRNLELRQDAADLKINQQEKEMQNNEHLKLLGLKVQDRVTGFKGVVTSVCFDLYGCIQVTVQPEVKKALILKMQDGSMSLD